MEKVNFTMVLHMHQPEGNFNEVFENVTNLSYHPLLEALYEYPDIPIGLHYSGILLEWLKENRPDTFDLLGNLVARGQVELLSGGFGEPILVMLPHRDRIGQIRRMNEYIRREFGQKPEGGWLTERVWEQSVIEPFAVNGIKYTMVDDSHFEFVGKDIKSLNGYYLTEDGGHTMKVFPMSVKMRYGIPFHQVSETIKLLRQNRSLDGNNVITYADDGEKFGAWPETYKHVYEDGWLADFFRALLDNGEWLNVVKPCDAARCTTAKGRAYLPDSSYREMMEWSLPADVLERYENVERRMRGTGEFEQLRMFLKTGTWRNFRVKYPEAMRMYARTLRLSRRIEDMPDGKARKTARDLLYRGQCNCPYWHGIFGGIHLAHLRYGVQRALIGAENVVDQFDGKKRPPANPFDLKYIRIEHADHDLDGFPETMLRNSRLALAIAPGNGAAICEMDVREKCFPALATLARRREAYHHKVLNPPNITTGVVESIHDLVRFKEEGLEKYLQYDRGERLSWVARFVPKTTSIDDLADNAYTEFGTFANGQFTEKIKRSKTRVNLAYTADGSVSDCIGPIRTALKKSVEVRAADAAMRFEHTVTNGGDRPIACLFLLEFNFALMAGTASDRYYMLGGHKQCMLGGRCRSEDQIEDAAVVDEWLGLKFRFDLENKARVHCYGTYTVANSEGGFEKVFQQAAVVPAWEIMLPPGGSQDIAFNLVVEDLRHT